MLLPDYRANTGAGADRAEDDQHDREAGEERMRENAHPNHGEAGACGKRRAGPIDRGGRLLLGPFTREGAPAAEREVAAEYCDQQQEVVAKVWRDDERRQCDDAHRVNEGYPETAVDFSTSSNGEHDRNHEERHAPGRDVDREEDADEDRGFRVQVLHRRILGP
jgi:hypothetical protein